MHRAMEEGKFPRQSAHFASHPHAIQIFTKFSSSQMCLHNVRLNKLERLLFIPVYFKCILIANNHRYSNIHSYSNLNRF